MYSSFAPSPPLETSLPSSLQPTASPAVHAASQTSSTQETVPYDVIDLTGGSGDEGAAACAAAESLDSSVERTAGEKKSNSASGVGAAPARKHAYACNQDVVAEKVGACEVAEQFRAAVSRNESLEKTLQNTHKRLVAEFAQKAALKQENKALKQECARLAAEQRGVLQRELALEEEIARLVGAVLPAAQQELEEEEEDDLDEEDDEGDEDEAPGAPVDPASLRRAHCCAFGVTNCPLSTGGATAMGEHIAAQQPSSAMAPHRSSRADQTTPARVILGTAPTGEEVCFSSASSAVASATTPVHQQRKVLRVATPHPAFTGLVAPPTPGAATPAAGLHAASKRRKRTWGSPEEQNDTKTARACSPILELPMSMAEVAASVARVAATAANTMAASVAAGANEAERRLARNDARDADAAAAELEQLRLARIASVEREKCTASTSGEELEPGTVAERLSAAEAARYAKGDQAMRDLGLAQAGSPEETVRTVDASVHEYITEAKVLNILLLEKDYTISMNVLKKRCGLKKRCPFPGINEQSAARIKAQMKRELKANILNLCDVSGTGRTRQCTLRQTVRDQQQQQQQQRQRERERRRRDESDSKDS